MPFGHRADPSIVYKYGCHIVGDSSPAFEQLKLANRFRNRLCEIELQRRSETDRLLSQKCPQLRESEQRIAALTSEIDQLHEAIKGNRVKDRAKTTGTKAQKEAIARLKEDRRHYVANRKRLRAALFGKETPSDCQPVRIMDENGFAIDTSAVRSELDAISSSSIERTKAASEEFGDMGLYWATRGFVSNSCSSFRSGSPPRFRRFDGNGTLAVQLQGGLSITDAMSGRGTIIRIRRVNDKQVDIDFRYGTSEDRTPVMLTLRTQWHRDLPEESSIKWVYLVCDKRATHSVWSIQFVVAKADGWDREDWATEGEVAVNIGWREGRRGTRAAYWIGIDGDSGVLELPSRFTERLTKVQEIQSTRDKLFNMAKEILLAARDRKPIPDSVRERVQYLDSRIASAHDDAKRDVIITERNAYAALASCDQMPSLPPAFQEELRDCGRWRSAARFAAMLIRWRADRTDGDEILFNAAEAWRVKDKHLYEWQANLRAKYLDYRLDTYRVFARTLARKYATCVIGNVDWKGMQDKPSPEVPDEFEHNRAGKVVTAPSILQRCLDAAFRECVIVPASNITATCHSCGQPALPESPPALMHTCCECGATWDQDRNACLNLLARGKVVDAAS